MRKFIKRFLAAALVCGMTGCGGEAEQTDTEQTVSETAQNQLSFEDVNVIEINGQQVSLPFKVEELGEGYSIGEERGPNETYPALYYQNQSLALVELDDEEKIISIAFYIDDFESNTAKIYNFSFENNFSQIIEAMGTPTREKEFALIYEYNQGKLYFGSENGLSGLNYLKISISEDSEIEDINKQD